MKISKNVGFLLRKIFVLSLCLAYLNGVLSQCGDNDWACDNGQCIDDDRRCDGRVDCRDKSDEIAENCIQFHRSCQDFAFRCDYGACIDGKARCNGIQDCADNSDELICTKKDDSDFQGECTDTEIQCVTSKECINSINLCDGQKNCRDGSDESLELCINYHCVNFGFQCGYGACISENARCNGIKECADGSDEAWGLCGTARKQSNLIDIITPKPTPTPTPKPTPTSELKSCIIPDTQELRELTFKHHPHNQTISLGSYVQSFETVHVECQNKYTLRGHPSLLCNNGRWNSDFPSCVAYCDGNLLRGVTFFAVCFTGNGYVECPKRIRPGTEIQIHCNFGYKPKRQFLKCLPDGRFDKQHEHCELSCGKVAPYSEALSKNGIPIEVNAAPWHVSIHENTTVTYDYICSGSIVSPRIVITAAHCFWSEETSTLRSITEYQIIAGRSVSNYTIADSKFSQTVDVEDIQIPFEYNGKTSSQKNDIAFVKLRTALRFSETIASICIPTEISSSASGYIQSDLIGYINGFGDNNHLERLKMVTLNYHSCLAKSPRDAPVADDKFCIFSRESGSVCHGDSGSGFFTENKIADGFKEDIIYRLLGVISNTPTTQNSCTPFGEDAYIAITNIYYMSKDFREKLLKAMQEDTALF